MKTRQTWRWVDAKGQRDREGGTLDLSQRLGSIELVFLLSIAHISGYSLIYHSNLGESLGARLLSYACFRFKLFYHWVGLRENLQEPPIFNGKNHGFL